MWPRCLTMVILAILVAIVTTGLGGSLNKKLVWLQSENRWGTQATGSVGKSYMCRVDATESRGGYCGQSIQGKAGATYNFLLSSPINFASGKLAGKFTIAITWPWVGDSGVAWVILTWLQGYCDGCNFVDRLHTYSSCSAPLKLWVVTEQVVVTWGLSTNYVVVFEELVAIANILQAAISWKLQANLRWGDLLWNWNWNSRLLSQLLSRSIFLKPSRTLWEFLLHF